MNPDGHITTQRSNSKSTADGGKKNLEEEKKKNPLSTWGLFKREKRAGGRISAVDRTVWSCVCQPQQPRRDGEALVSSWRWKFSKKKKSMCVLFNVKPDTVQKDYIIYVW